MPFIVVHWIFFPSELWIGYAVCIFSCDNSCFNLKDLSSTIHGWVSYKYPSANAHIWALDILLSPECCEWQVTVSWSKYGVHLTTARVHSPKRRILTTKHQAPSTIPSSDHFFNSCSHSFQLAWPWGLDGLCRVNATFELMAAIGLALRAILSPDLVNTSSPNSQNLQVWSQTSLSWFKSLF